MRYSAFLLAAAILSGCLTAEDPNKQAAQKVEAADDAACRQQVANVSATAAQQQAYTECRRLRVADRRAGATSATVPAR
jgi:hypothetical protein